MNKLLKTLFTSVLAITMTACSSAPQEPQMEVKKVGKVQKVMLMSNEKKPSFVELLAGATLGGYLGNQFGGGSGKYWTTSIGALAGAKAVDSALSEKYKSIHYVIYYTEDKTKKTLISKNVNSRIFKGDLVIVTQKGEDFTIDAYGKYTKKRSEKLHQMLISGNLPD